MRGSSLVEACNLAAIAQKEDNSILEAALLPESIDISSGMLIGFLRRSYDSACGRAVASARVRTRERVIRLAMRLGGGGEQRGRRVAVPTPITSTTPTNVTESRGALCTPPFRRVRRTRRTYARRVISFEEEGVGGGEE